MCNDAYKSPLAMTVYFVGVTLGGIIFGTLSDRFGRRPMVIITMLSPIVVGLILFFVKNYIAFVVLRLILGVFIQVHKVYHMFIFQNPITCEIQILSIIKFSTILVYYCKCCNLIGYSARYLFLDR